VTDNLIVTGGEGLAIYNEALGSAAYYDTLATQVVDISGNNADGYDGDGGAIGTGIESGDHGIRLANDATGADATHLGTAKQTVTGDANVIDADRKGMKVLNDAATYGVATQQVDMGGVDIAAGEAGVHVGNTGATSGTATQVLTVTSGSIRGADGLVAEASSSGSAIGSQTVSLGLNLNTVDLTATGGVGVRATNSASTSTSVQQVAVVGGTLSSTGQLAYISNSAGSQLVALSGTMSAKADKGVEIVQTTGTGGRQKVNVVGTGLTVDGAEGVSAVQALNAGYQDVDVVLGYLQATSIGVYAMGTPIVGAPATDGQSVEVQVPLTQIVAPVAVDNAGTGTVELNGTPVLP
jgi:hypothetical protein